MPKTKPKLDKADILYRQKFIRALAEFLCGDQAHMSILLQMGNSEARAWAKLMSASPVRGWATVDEAEKVLRKFLGFD